MDRAGADEDGALTGAAELAAAAAALPDLATLDRELAAARTAGDPDVLAERLARHATALVQAGRIGEARQELDQAAALHRDRGRTTDEARCTHFAATLCRLEGHLDLAADRAHRAERVAGPGTPAAAAAATELAEQAMLTRAFAAAAEHYARACAHGREAGLVPAAEAALLHKRAQALGRIGDVEGVAADLRQAHELLVQAGDPAGARRVLVELATALQSAGLDREAGGVMDEASALAEEAGDAAALAELGLLASARALRAGDAAEALAAVRRARTHALAAVAPVPYVSASVTIAELCDRQGDRLGAYEALAVGWVTLGDLMGKDVARATFEPKLSGLRSRWGDEDFVAVRDRYAAMRRAAQE